MTDSLSRAVRPGRRSGPARLNPFGKDATARQRKTRRLMVSLLVIVAAWELYGRYGVETELFFVPLSKVIEAGIALWSSGELQVDIMASFQALAWGMLLAIVVGIALGVVIAINQTVREYCDPYVSALYATPLVAVAPILILAFGLGVVSKLAVVFLTAVFPILINTVVGIRQTDESFIEVARSYDATPAQIVARVLVPSSVPFVVAGIRLAVGRGIVGVVVGELFGSEAGLGNLIFESGQTFDVASLYVGVLLLCLAGVSLTGLVHWIERRIAPWHHFALDEERAAP